MTKDSLPSGAATSIARVLDRAATVNIKKDTMIYVDMVGWPTTKETITSKRLKNTSKMCIFTISSEEQSENLLFILSE